MINPIFAVFMAATVAFSSSGPVPYTKVRVFVLRPPEVVLPGVSRVAVLGFEERGPGRGRNSYEEETVLNEHVMTALMQSDRGIEDIRTGLSGLLRIGRGKPGVSLQEGATTALFTLVERHRLEQVLQEANLEQSYGFQPEGATRLGGLLGVDAVLMGSFEHTEEYSYGENCRSAELRATARVRVILVETGEIVASADKAGSVDKTECGQDQLPPHDALLGEALQDLGSSISDLIAPRFVLREFELEEISTPQFKNMAKQAADAAEDLRIDEAYLLYSSIYQQDPYNPRVTFNLGILNEVVGNYGPAREFYEISVQLRNVERYREATARAKAGAALKEVLRPLGVWISEHDFSAGQDKIEEVSADWVVVLGDAESRKPVYQDPQASEPIAQVPGGVTFRVLEELVEWFRIELPGGQEVFISKQNAQISR